VAHHSQHLGRNCFNQHLGLHLLNKIRDQLRLQRLVGALKRLDQTYQLQQSQLQLLAMLDSPTPSSYSTRTSQKIWMRV
jgi:hypothetical protein